MVRFSVVVPAYNAEDTLAETLDAVLGQTFAGWECIVVDDGSSDGTYGVAERYRRVDPRFKVIAQENRGTGGAYNTGVKAASGEWVTICSADDLLLPTHLESMDAAIDRYPDADILSCNGYFLWPDGTRESVYTARTEAKSRPWSLEEVMWNCFFSVGACYRRSWFGRVGGYLEHAYGEDYDFWLRAMAAGARHRYIPEALAVHRRSETQKSAARDKAYESDIGSLERVLGKTSLGRRQRFAARRAIVLRRLLLIDEHGRFASFSRSLLKIWYRVASPKRG